MLWRVKIPLWKHFVIKIWMINLWSIFYLLNYDSQKWRMLTWVHKPLIKISWIFVFFFFVQIMIFIRFLGQMYTRHAYMIIMPKSFNKRKKSWQKSLSLVSHVKDKTSSIPVEQWRWASQLFLPFFAFSLDIPMDSQLLKM